MTDPPALLPGSLSEGVQRGVRFRLGCPSRDVMRHVNSRWGVPILIALQGGVPRFGELRRKVSGVSERMLAQTLQSRESDGLGDRRAFPVVPPHVEYSLTPLGREAAAKIASLADWIEDNLEHLRARSAPS